jgi:glycosyltransferase involved in cell wall biosynthesis
VATKFLFNASNLHIGGGIQVATSALSEWAEMHTFPTGLVIWASTEVDANLKAAGVDVSSLPGYQIEDSYGLCTLFSSHSKALQSFERVLTVFGPIYTWKMKPYGIVGFAQPWIIYPNNECYAKLSFIQILKTRLKYWVQGMFFKRAHVLVVELEHVKQGLIRVLGIPAERIHVIHNCLSSIYLDESSWQLVDVPKAEGCYRLGFVGRNYIHKNTSIFPAIASLIEQKYGIKTRFYVTFTEEEWKACTPVFRAICINVGPLGVAQCPNFYKTLDAVVFPSLLECFSATPLEAMAMKKPLFVSDKPFNRDVCGDHAHYFDPLSAESAAETIANVFLKGELDEVALQAARDHAINFSSPRERAEKFLALLTHCANEPKT